MRSGDMQTSRGRHEDKDIHAKNSDHDKESRGFGVYYSQARETVWNARFRVTPSAASPILCFCKLTCIRYGASFWRDLVHVEAFSAAHQPFPLQPFFKIRRDECQTYLGSLRFLITVSTFALSPTEKSFVGVSDNDDTCQCV